MLLWILAGSVLARVSCQSRAELYPNPSHRCRSNLMRGLAPVWRQPSLRLQEPRRARLRASH